jgi:peptidoglycan/LPS O-acetylase OafA/YrhL
LGEDDARKENLKTLSPGFLAILEAAFASTLHVELPSATDTTILTDQERSTPPSKRLTVDVPIFQELHGAIRGRKKLSLRTLSFLRPGIFRLFLATTVLVCHSSRFDLGDWAVYTFFVLSGYWIHRMWTQKYSRTDSPFVIFIASRLMRILPVFWLANVLSAIVAAAIDPSFLNPSAPHWGALPAAASNLFLLGYAKLPHSQGALHVAWSLDIEMQFYLLFPFILYLCTRPRSGTFWTYLVGAACIAGFVLFVAPPEMVSHNLGCRGLFFLVGAASAHRDWRPTEKWAATSLALTAAIVVVCWSLPGLRHLFENGRHGATLADFHQKRIAQALLTLVSAPVALFSVRNPSGSSDRALGELTYVIYLVHWPIMTLHQYYFLHLNPIERLPSLLGAWIVVAVVSLAVYRYFDQPIEAVRKRWVAARVIA